MLTRADKQCILRPFGSMLEAHAESDPPALRGTPSTVRRSSARPAAQCRPQRLRSGSGSRTGLIGEQRRTGTLLAAKTPLQALRDGDRDAVRHLVHLRQGDGFA